MKPFRSDFLARNGWIAAYALAASLPLVLFQDSYLMGTFAAIAIFAIALVGLDLVIGYGELLAFSHGAFLALGAYVMGILSARYGLPLPLGICVAAAVNGAIALLIGYATLKLRGYYLAVATLGFGIIVIEMLGGLVEYTGGWSGLRGVAPATFFGVRIASDSAFYLIAVIVLFIGLLFGRILVASSFGRAIRACGNNDTGAEVAGIPTARYRLQLFVVGALYCSLAGSLYALFLRVVTPANFDVITAIDMVLMLFLGGKETLWGPILGVATVRLLPEFVEGLSDYRTIVQGLVFILVLIFMPNGIAGLLIPIVRKLRGPAGIPSGRVAQAAPVALDIVGDERGPVDAPLLTASRVSKSFEGVVAVAELSFSVNRGQLKAIIGPNGAGKTTLLNMLSGVLSPDSGSIRVFGVDTRGRPPHELAALGLSRTFQTPKLFTNMTVLENALVGQHRALGAGMTRALFPGPSTREKERKAWEYAESQLAYVGLANMASASVDSLSFGQRRLLEIAKALGSRPKLLLLDEPAAGLNDAEKDKLARLLLELRDTFGISLVLVEHDTRLVMRIADEVFVMNQGSQIAEGSPSTVQRDKAVLDAYLGHEAYARG